MIIGASVRSSGGDGLVVPTCGTVAVLLSAERPIRSRMNIYSVKRICKLPQVAMTVKAELDTCDVFQMYTFVTLFGNITL